MKKYNKNIHHIHDKGYKDLYSKKEIAIDLFKNVIKKEWTEKIRIEDLTLINKSFITSDYKESECDIVYKAKIGEEEVVFYILLEFQSQIDYTMPLRLLFYMTELLREYSRNANHKKYDKNAKVPAIIPIVLYNGNKIWDVPTEFRKTIYNQELFGNGLLNFEYNVIDVNNDFSKEELINSNNVSSAIFLLDQEMNVMEYINRIKAVALFFQDLSKTELMALKHWIKNTMEETVAKMAIDILDADREDVELMVANNAFVLKEMREESKNEGFNEGFNNGFNDGFNDGFNQGMEELLIKQISTKLGDIPEYILLKIKKLNKEELDKLVVDIFEINNFIDLAKYLK